MPTIPPLPSRSLPLMTNGGVRLWAHMHTQAGDWFCMPSSALFSTLFFQIISHWVWRLLFQLDWVAREPPSSFLPSVHPPQIGVTDMCCCTWLLCLGIWIQALIPAHQVHCPLRHLLSPSQCNKYSTTNFPNTYAYMFIYIYIYLSSFWSESHYVSLAGLGACCVDQTGL